MFETQLWFMKITIVSIKKKRNTLSIKPISRYEISEIPLKILTLNFSANKVTESHHLWFYIILGLFCQSIIHSL